MGDLHAAIFGKCNLSLSQVLQYYLEALWKEIEDTVFFTYELGCTMSMCGEDFRADTALREEANPPEEAS